MSILQNSLEKLETKILDAYLALLDKIIHYYDTRSLNMRTPRAQLRDFFRNARLRLENEEVAQILVVALTSEQQILLLTGSNAQDTLVLAEEAARVAKNNLTLKATEGKLQ